MTNFEMVQEFQKKFNCFMDMTVRTEEGTVFLLDAARHLRDISWDLEVAALQHSDNRLLRGRLMLEEMSELLEALAIGDRAEIAKEAADVHYVVYGTEDAYNLPANKVFKAVHDSNMSKSQDRDSGGKILKGPDYRAPSIQAILEEAA